MYNPNYIKVFYNAYGQAEWDRLETGAYGHHSIIHNDFVQRHLKPGDRVLDAGNGPGRFSITASRLGADPLNPRLSRGFLEYVQRRSFIADPAGPGHPKDRSKVGHGISYVRERFFKGGQFNSLADMREQARNWCLKTAEQNVASPGWVKDRG